MAERSKAGTPGTLLALGLTIVLFAIVHAPAFRSPYVINDDVRQQVCWMQTWQEAALYPDDLLTDYARRYVPWGVKAIYRSVAPWVNPLHFSKILTGLLFVLIALGLFRIGEDLGGRPLAWALLLAGWNLPFLLYDISGGIAHSFALPLVTWFIHARLQRRPGRMGILLLLQALCIPYLFLLCGLATGLMLTAAFGRRQLTLRQVALPAACLLIGAAVVLTMNHQMNSAGYGPLVTRAEMAGRPEFGPAGRYHMLPGPSLFDTLILRPWEHLGMFSRLGPLGGGLTCALIAALMAGGACRAPWRALGSALRPLAPLLLAGVALYLAARLLLLRLFVPDRYLMYLVDVAYVLLLGFTLRHLLPPRLLHSRPARALLILLAFAAGAWRLHAVGLYDYRADAPLCAAVARLPADVLTAGHPALMDNTLTFGRRKALVTYELSHPWSRGYWPPLRQRTVDLFAAYYAPDAATVTRFCAAYGIDYLIVDRRHYTPAFIAAGAYFAPFADDLRRSLPRTPSFALLDRSQFRTIAVSDSQWIVDMTADERYQCPTKGTQR